MERGVSNPHSYTIDRSAKNYSLEDMETYCTLAASKMYEACLQAVQGEQLSGETGHPDDEIYMRAVNDCIEAIKRLPVEASSSATGERQL